ncbi:hypothetical protein CFC21_039889 [Triticum aestivum]|uniref:Uncharacterized protein n=2 Tax=Triticum aestivum TaxID=4565 RepID=A0A9R1JSD2_WHEAT|nr:uncharacterized protein LOC123068706 [Triticum aestivum]KAF7027896.1 hypothetical protein CFC21_039889 [Triticum aestivum]CDM81340.1 unnamed protein product [Triticum aestivum]
MPSQQIPATPVGGITSRRHAKLLLHLVEGDGGAAAGGGASVKDLRLRRVVPPASATLDVSPECAAAAAKPGSVQIQSTPPEPAAAAEDRERKPILPRSKLVRDPGSFGYRRLLPFLNQMANKGSDISSVKDMPSENKVPIPNKELSRSDSGLADEMPPVVGSQGGAAPVGSVEPPVVKDGTDSEICDSVKEETKVVVPVDLASSKPSLARCTRSKFVHHPSSFSYKRMLPFLMENDISSQEGDRAKFRRLSEEKQITSDQNDVQASGQIQPATVEVSLDASAAEVQKATQGEELASVGDPLSSEKGALASDAVPAGGQRQPPVSEDTPDEGNVAEVESTVEEKASKSDEKPVPMDSVEPPVVKAEGTQEVKDCCDSAKEETKIVPGDLASSKPSIPRCMRSKFVPHRSSFSYKRMLPFLMQNETSSQKEDMAKLQTVSEEKQLALPENDVLASGNHLSVSEGSPEACYQAELDRIVEEISFIPDENYLLKGVQLQSVVPVTEVSLDVSTAEMQKVTQEVLASDGDLLSPDKGELTLERNDVLAGGQCQLAVSDGSAKESDVAEAERIVEEKATKSDENSVLNGKDIQSAVSEVSPEDGDTDEMKEVTEKPALTADGDESSGLAADKGEFLMKDQPQACGSKELQCNADLAVAQQCQSPESGCSIKTVMVDGGADPHGAPERHDSVASLGGLLLDVGMISKPSEPSIGSPLSAEGMSGCVAHAESGLSKVGTPSPLGSPCLEQQRLSPKIPSPSSGAFSGASFLKKRGFSPKKLSPKKGILKRHTMGCRGICMCLDCSVFRLHADRAFEFSRKQMQEADDIIVNLLEEVASLRSLAEKSSGQQEQMEACQRALRVEEVAKERRQQMLAELNSHCKIPGPRVKFAQYVEGKMASSPSSSSSRRQ